MIFPRFSSFFTRFSKFEIVLTHIKTIQRVNIVILNRKIKIGTPTPQHLSTSATQHPSLMGQICDDIFSRAEDQAKKSSMVHRHGAVIVRGNMVIGEGYNQRSTYMSHNYSMHAEIAAIHSIPRKNRNRKHLEDSTMVVIRIAGKDNHCALSAPCANCRKEIQKLGIRRVFYSQ